MKKIQTKPTETNTQDTGPHTVQLDNWISCAPFEELLGIKIIEVKEGRAVLTMPFVFQLAQGRGLVHGGAVVTLADTAVAMAIKSIVPEKSHFGTIKIDARFLAPVKKGILCAKARVKILEDRKIQGICTVFDEDEKEIMQFSSVFKLARNVTLLT